MSQRALAAAAVAVAVVAPAVLTATPASAEIQEFCGKVTTAPKTIYFPGGSTTIDNMPNGLDWSRCID